VKEKKETMRIKRKKTNSKNILCLHKKVGSIIPMKETYILLEKITRNNSRNLIM